MSHSAPTLPGAALGWWRPEGTLPSARAATLRDHLLRVREPFFLVSQDGVPLPVSGGTAVLGAGAPPEPGCLPLLAHVPACPPEALGDAGFCQDHGLRFPYLCGAMANAIASVELVEAAARAGLLGFFGAAGLSLERVEAAIDRLQGSLGGAATKASEAALPRVIPRSAPYGFNLIHSPNEPDLEAEVVGLYLRKGVRLVEASAYLDLTLPVVRYRVSGLRRGPDGAVTAPNRVIAKVSRVEVAAKFFSPPPESILRELVESKQITPEEASLAASIPVAQDVTGEADSGGHTDNRPLVTILPSLLALRDSLQERHGYAQPLRVGAAGGISTPASVAAAFAMGAAYVLTGSVNQACMESGTCDAVRSMLAKAAQADTAMAPAADMFEMGVKVQVLKRGTMFAMRAAKLYEAYKSFAGIAAIPADRKAALERELFRAPLEDIWRLTREFFLKRDPAQVERAERDPKHQMALVFRWYLGLASRWANAGEPGRNLDYQVWCGPAMGAFNEWARGSFLEAPAQRTVATVALNLLFGASYLARVRGLCRQGVRVEPEAQRFSPMTLSSLQPLLEQ